MKHSLKQTIRESFFIIFQENSVFEKDLLCTNPKYATIDVEVLQLICYQKGSFMAELIEPHKYNKYK